MSLTLIFLLFASILISVISYECIYPIIFKSCNESKKWFVIIIKNLNKNSQDIDIFTSNHLVICENYHRGILSDIHSDLFGYTEFKSWGSINENTNKTLEFDTTQSIFEFSKYYPKLKYPHHELNPFQKLNSWIGKYPLWATFGYFVKATVVILFGLEDINTLEDVKNFSLRAVKTLKLEYSNLKQEPDQEIAGGICYFKSTCEINEENSFDFKIKLWKSVDLHSKIENNDYSANHKSDIENVECSTKIQAYLSNLNKENEIFIFYIIVLIIAILLIFLITKFKKENETNQTPFFVYHN